MDVIVSAVFNNSDEKYHITVGFPPTQEKLSVKESTHILVSGISLLIKSCSNNQNGIKDYELIKEVIEHLNLEFTSINSFNDLKMEPKYFKHES